MFQITTEPLPSKRTSFAYNLKNNRMEWKDTKYQKPITYKTGHWDGKNSDQVIVQNKNGDTIIAIFCNGFMDGLKFESWYNDRDFEIETEIIRWMPIPE